MFNQDILEILKDKKLLDRFWQGNYGLEKENIRVDKDGSLARTEHPKIFGNKLKNPYITTDFGEAQLELITPVCHSLEDTLTFLLNIESIVYTELDNEYLWPQSSPPTLPSDEDIDIARYDSSPEGRRAENYRVKLAESYGRKKQMLSGIHYNFSFSDNILKVLHRELGANLDYGNFKNNLYLKLSRNFFKYRWLLIYLFGASPIVHSSYSTKCLNLMKPFSKDAYSFNKSTSFRNGKCGYKNRIEDFVPYDTLENYIETIHKLIKEGKIQNEKEYYSALRLKSKDGTLSMLKEEGIEYLELRLLDINPFAQGGIDIDTMYFIQAFMWYMLILPEDDYSEESVDIANRNHYVSSCMGLGKDLHLYDEKGDIVDFKLYARRLIDNIEALYNSYNLLNTPLNKAIYIAREAIEDSNLTIAGRIKEAIQGRSYIDFHMNLAKTYKEKFLSKTYSLLSFEDLELSTQILIRESIKRGVKFKLLDRKANFITLESNGKIEYIKQATKTSIDSYISFLIMENKLVSKDILDRNSIRTPKGHHFDNIQEALALYHTLDLEALVIKPNNTNFGIGITIFKTFPSYQEYKEALELAFSKDHTILIEEFIKGKEYRFLVIGDEVVGILHRVPANIKGDGLNTIERLVEIKNLNPLRGVGYKSPLEKIKLGRSEELFLKSQGLDKSYIPKKDEIIYLRENSNISTGGDSIDYTDDIDSSYKLEAIRATKAVGAKICGVDMMINNIKTPKNNENYAIIEVNFNPAIHIHSYPYIGKDRKAGEKILELLELI